MQAADILPRQFSGMLYIAGHAKVSPPIPEPCVKMELLLLSYGTFSLPGERHLLHKLFTVCCVLYNVLVKQ